MSDDNFLSRWSRRKLASKATPAAVADPPAAGVVPEKPAPAILKPGGTQSPAPVEEKPSEPLPPLESLTPDSDFTPFMKAEVDPETKRQALKALFQDPHFNVMDGLDVYIDDYSKPDPLPAGWLEKMHQFAYLGDRGQRDREEAARAEAAAPAAAPAGDGAPRPDNVEQEQLLAAADAPVPSHTADGVSPSPELPESAGKAAG